MSRSLKRISAVRIIDALKQGFSNYV